MDISCAFHLIGTEDKCPIQPKSIRDFLCTNSCALAKQPIGNVNLLIGKEGSKDRCLSTTELMSFVDQFAKLVQSSGYVLLAHTSNLILNARTHFTGCGATKSNTTT